MGIKVERIAIGNAHEDGRAPSHDGEYLTLYYRPASSDWILSDNAGVVATNHNILDVVRDSEDPGEVERWVNEIGRLMGRLRAAGK